MFLLHLGEDLKNDRSGNGNTIVICIQVMETIHSSAQLAGHTYGAAANINHIAHLSGALVGVALIWLINQIPSLGDDSKSSISRKDQAQE